MRELRGEERWVAACIESVLENTKVRQHDDGSRDGMHDLDIWRGDRRFAAVEVTAAADSESIELWNIVNGGGKTWTDARLAGGWLVTLTPAANAKRLKQHLPNLLAALELRGIRDINRGSLCSVADEDAASMMHVARAHRGDTANPGSIYITIELPSERAGGAVASTGDELACWLSAWAQGKDQRHNVEKLLRAGTPERHLFVLFPGFTSAPFGVSDLLLRPDAPAPEVDPRLPAGVTHVWAMSTWTSGDGFFWSPELGWTRFPKIFVV